MNDVSDDVIQDARRIWAALAGDASTFTEQVRFRVVPKSRHALLILPKSRVVALSTLSLYSPQSLKARLAKRILQATLFFGIPPPLKSCDLWKMGEHGFGGFLSKLVDGDVPNFGVLSGYAKADGRRFVLLIHDKRNHPIALIKVGVSGLSADLVSREATVLDSLPPEFSYSPRILDTFQNTRLSAFAIKYFCSLCSVRQLEQDLPHILKSWVTREKQICLKDTRLWKEIDLSIPETPKPIRAILSSQFHPSIYHGDITPWNTRLTAQDEVVFIDWERGDLQGIPGWDWFHYVIQTSTLVKRLRPERTLRCLLDVIQSKTFSEYSRRSGIQNIENELLLAYLLYAHRVLKPAQGFAELKIMFKLLSDTLSTNRQNE